jgi:hypothetical protein
MRWKRDRTGGSAAVMGAKQGSDHGRLGKTTGIKLRIPQQAWLDMTAWQEVRQKVRRQQDIR